MPEWAAPSSQAAAKSMAALSAGGVTPPWNSHQHAEEAASWCEEQNTGTTVAEIKRIWPESKSGGK